MRNQGAAVGGIGALEDGGGRNRAVAGSVEVVEDGVASGVVGGLVAVALVVGIGWDGDEDAVGTATGVGERSESRHG